MEVCFCFLFFYFFFILISSWVRVCWIGLNGISKSKLVRSSCLNNVTISSLDASLPFTQDVPSRTVESRQRVTLVPDASSLTLDVGKVQGKVMATAALESGEEWELDSRTWLAKVLPRFEQEVRNKLTNIFAFLFVFLNKFC
jgi:glutamine synthetase